MKITCMQSALHDVCHTVGTQQTLGRNLRKQRKPVDIRRMGETKKSTHRGLGFYWVQTLSTYDLTESLLCYGTQVSLSTLSDIKENTSPQGWLHGPSVVTQDPRLRRVPHLGLNVLCCHLENLWRTIP